MERYQVILAYDGSHFKGFQRQATDRTVQGVVEIALRKLGWQGTSILAAGRTDTGTHATGQVITFDLQWDHDLHDLLRALNNHLPCDVVASKALRVRPDFHPRYDASWRKYQYRIYCQPVRQPLLEPYSWRVWPAVDFGALREAADLLIGAHDFVSFGSPPHPGGNTTRRVLESSWKLDEPFFIYEIMAQAFLYHMVRRLVFTQVAIAQGRLDLSDLLAALDLTSGTVNENSSRQKMENRSVHGLAPAKGLILAEVQYPLDVLLVSEDNVEINNSVDGQLDPAG